MGLKELIKKQQEIINLAKTENRDLTEEEQREFDRLQGEIDALLKSMEENADNEPKTGEKSNEDSFDAKEYRTYVREVMKVCNTHNVADKIDEYLEKEMTVDEIKADILDNMAKNERQPINARVTQDEQDKFKEAATDALLIRSGDFEIEASNNEYRGYSLKELAVECLKKDGENVRSMDPVVIYETLTRQWYNPSTTFSAVLDNTIGKALVEGHKTAGTTFERFVKKGTLRDFKESRHEYLMGSAGRFLKVPENGELKHDVWEDKALPTRKLETYGRQFSLSRQMFINDDIGVVTSIPKQYAASAKRTQNEQVYRILFDNPTIYDGNKLFDKDKHGNVLKTGTGVTLEALQKMIMAMGNQKDEFGEPIMINVKGLIVPIGLAFDLRTILDSPTINTTGNTQAVNPLYSYRNLEVVEDPTLNALAGKNACPWFLFANSADTGFIQVDYLNGNETPLIRRSEKAGTLGFVWDIFLDWAISVRDYRGAIRNNGVALANPLDN